MVSVILTLGLQLAVIYVPFLQQIFTMTALSIGDLAVSLGLSTLVFWAKEKFNGSPLAPFRIEKDRLRESLEKEVKVHAV